MYERKSSSGHVIRWDPENTDAAIDAVAQIVEDVDVSDVEDRAPVEVDSETAEEIRDEYASMLEEKG